MRVFWTTSKFKQKKTNVVEMRDFKLLGRSIFSIGCESQQRRVGDKWGERLSLSYFILLSRKKEVEEDKTHLPIDLDRIVNEQQSCQNRRNATFFVILLGISSLSPLLLALEWVGKSKREREKESQGRRGEGHAG